MPRDRSQLEPLERWLVEMTKLGLLRPTSARLRWNALVQLSTVLGANEPREAEWLLRNLEELAQRWAATSKAQADTVAQYKSRARSTLADYIEFRNDPDAFVAKRRQANNPTRKGTLPGSQRHSPLDGAQATFLFHGHGAATGTRGALPLGQGQAEVFAYQLPDRRLRMQDVWRIAAHLMTLSVDFDLSDPLQKQVLMANRQIQTEGNSTE